LDFWSFVRDYAQTITAGGVIVALFISIFTLISLRKHGTFQTLMEVYKLVNSLEERSLKRSLKRRTIFKKSKLKQLSTKVSLLTLVGITIARLLISLQLVILDVHQIPKKLSITLKKKNLN